MTVPHTRTVTVLSSLVCAAISCALPNSDAATDAATEDEEKTGYQVVGGAKVGEVSALASVQPRHIESSRQAYAMECPFIYDPSPCDAEACQEDASSPDCDAAVSQYCQEHGDDPACDYDQGDGGGDGCPFQYEPNPCGAQECHDPSTPEACEQVHEDYCMQHPDDPACSGTGGEGPGGGGGEGGEGGGCPYLYEPNPCDSSACSDPESESCHDAHFEYCEEHPDDPACNHGDGGDRPDPVAYDPPAGMWMKIYKLEVSEDAAACTNPIVVAEDDEPEYQNMMDSPVLFTGDPPPDGEYPCIIITMSDHLRFQGTEKCPDLQEIDIVREGVNENVIEESVVTLYLSTSGRDPLDHSEASRDAPWTPPGIMLASPFIANPDILQSTFFLKSPGVSVFEDGECDMEAPLFGFETTYK